MNIRELREAVAVVRVPGWAFDYQSPGWYWGWRHSVQIGPWIIFWGRMSEAAILRALEQEGCTADPCPPHKRSPMEHERDEQEGRDG